MFNKNIIEIMPVVPFGADLPNEYMYVYNLPKKENNKELCQSFRYRFHYRHVFDQQATAELQKPGRPEEP